MDDPESARRDVREAETRVEEAEHADLAPADMAEERHRLTAARARLESLTDAMASQPRDVR
jgi:hypothetical protein